MANPAPPQNRPVAAAQNPPTAAGGGRPAAPAKAQPQRTRAGKYVAADSWGITRSQLADLLAQSRAKPEWSDADNVRQFVTKFVIPLTRGTGMGYSLYINQEKPKEVNLMISHSWEENALRFFQDVISEMTHKEKAFICFLALYQGTPQEIAHQLGGSVLMGPFGQAIAKCKHEEGRLLVVTCEELRENGQGLYSRMWCDLEIYHAIRQGCQVQFSRRTTSEHLFGRDAESFSCVRARCGNPQLAMNADERKIRRVIETYPVKSATHRRLATMTWMPLFSIALTGTFGLLWDTCVRLHPHHVSIFVDNWWQLLLAALMLGVLGLSLDSFTKWLYGRWLPSQGGYEDLDSVIRAAAEFHEQSPGALLDPHRWTHGRTKRPRDAVLHELRQTCRGKSPDETLPQRGRCESCQRLARSGLIWLFVVLRGIVIYFACSTVFFDNDWGGLLSAFTVDVCRQWFVFSYAAIGAWFFLRATADLLLSGGIPGVDAFLECFVELIVAGTITVSGGLACQGQEAIDGVYPQSVVNPALVATGVACVVVAPCVIYSACRSAREHRQKSGRVNRPNGAVLLAEA